MRKQTQPIGKDKRQNHDSIIFMGYNVSNLTYFFVSFLHKYRNELLYLLEWYIRFSKMAIYDVVILYHKRINHACKIYDVPNIIKWNMYFLILEKGDTSWSNKKRNCHGMHWEIHFFVSHGKPFKAGIKVNFYGLFVLHVL